jgi:hypothetical protein
MERYHCRYADVFQAEYGAYYSVEEVDARLATLTSELAEARAALASRTEDLVWAVVHGAELDGDRIWWFRQLNEDSGDVDIECDGTPASIAAAVEKARKG